MERSRVKGARIVSRIDACAAAHPGYRAASLMQALGHFGGPSGRGVASQTRTVRSAEAMIRRCPPETN
jgi:hypothetical protein